MDSKTKHRVLGVLVIIGLGVLAYPLLQNSDEVPTEKVLVKAPPFPDQSTPVDQGAGSPTPTITSPDATDAPAPSSAMPMPSTEGEDANGGMSQQPDDTITQQPAMSGVSAPSITAEPPVMPDAKPETPAAPVAKPVAQPSSASPDPSDDVSLATPDDDTTTLLPPDTKQSKVVAHTPTVKAKVAKKSVKAASVAAVKKSMPVLAAAAFKMPRHDDSNGLLKLNQAAWVIQVGSFDNKASALRLVNNLRENGYRAFIQQVPGSRGDSTQVFVGPENRQTLARALATQLYSDMKVQGIVISYQPFSL